MAEPLSCIGVLCADIGSWADWFSGLASATAVLVALGGYGFVEWQHHLERHRGDVDTAQLIGMKIFRVLNSTHDLHRHVWADHDGPPLMFGDEAQVWRNIHPLIGVSFDTRLNLDGQEIGLLIRMEQASYLTDIILAISRYESIVAAMNEYRSRYDAFQQMTPEPVEMQGRVGKYVLTREEYMRLKPHNLTLEHLILSIREMTKENADSCRDLARQFHPMMKARFKKDRFIALSVPDA